MNPQQVATVVIGVEQIAWENPNGDQRVTVELRRHMQEHFAGRGTSELWEPLSGRPGCPAGTSHDASRLTAAAALDLVT